MPFGENGEIYGSFKKICVQSKDLQEEANILAPNLLLLKEKFENNRESQSLLTFEIVTLYLEHRIKQRAYLNKGKGLPHKSDTTSFLEFVRFYGMPDTVRFALWKWNAKIWDLRLIDYNPSSYEMLESQSQGYRFVSFLWNEALHGKLVEGKRDAFEHLLHDLAHAYMFFREEYDYLGQVEFFKKLLSFYHKFEPFLSNDPIFNEKFSYCISDMNSHPAHLTAYLNAICREAGFVSFLK
ncbi:MAG: hypothetical protein O9301_11985 [Leptospira sp.]|nr:hypothetical protein [Leptospira sp.]